MTKVDVCMNYYGKPFQSVVTLKTLWAESGRHIDKIYVIIEKEQPHNLYDSIALLKYLLKDLPVIYFTPKAFYYGVGSPPLEALQDPEQRYGLNFQYAFEKTDKEFLFITHNDCLYKSDLLGKMLQSLDSSANQPSVAGIGLIGQCWNCPAFSAKLCNSDHFPLYKPSSTELIDIIESFPTPRKSIHYDLIGRGNIHPLPECRLNEYACLINASLYNKEVMPNGNVVPFGGSWHGTDTGAAWFYDMVNLGHQFINFPFEPHMTHAPFSVTGSGHMNNTDLELYNQAENQAYEYLTNNKLIDGKIPLNIRFERNQIRLQRLVLKVGNSLKSRLKSMIGA
jgi:hypothetical protein